ncbi:PrsW family intramembrane metalloprotease [soil metagenome]
MGTLCAMQPANTPQTASEPGWYPDPWGQPGHWRWWSGQAWTANVTVNAVPQRKPRLPAWLSVPVILGGLIMIPLLIFTFVATPLAIPLGIVPALIVCPVLIWLDRVEPEPRPARIHALLWGALTATAVSIIINSLADALFGEAISTVVSAPLVEEGMKAAAILWAVRRHEVDSVMDGVVYAGWVAIGFAVVEDMLYFSTALAEGDLVVVFVIRAVLSPFAHPLFTVWTGIAIGRAIQRPKPVLPAAMGGYVIAVITHAMWNGSLVNAENMGGELFLLVTAVLFVTLFFSVAIVLYRLRRKEEQRFVAAVPWMAHRYQMATGEVEVFGHFRQMMRTRKQLPAADRTRFDAVHAALARLAVLHNRPDGSDLETEARLVDQLQRARSGT